MSVESEERLTVGQSEEVSSTESSKKSVRSYTREFLLSFGESEACKKLPNDFDESLLSEFHETSHYSSQDRPRVSGSSSLQGFRRSDYGSSPPARGLDRWDSRSTGKSEGDLDSESGRRYGNQGRRTWQNPEHDGLLGSGSFSRPPGYAAGSAAPRFRPTENAQLNKSNEPYQPPRPYKAGPYSRRETKDSFNDETFGSSDLTDEDRAEEENKRRAEFELMRMEHHKAFQENQKSNSGRPKDSFSEMVGLLENTNDSKFCGDSDSILKGAPHDDASNLSVSSHAPPTRPLVPPGFVSGVVDKSSASKSNVHADALQVENLEVEQGPQNVKSMTQERGSNDWFGEMISSSNLKAKEGVSPILHGFDQATSSNLPVLTSVLENGESLGLDFDISGHKMLADPVQSTSIFDKLFGNDLTTSCDSTSNIVKGDDPKTDDIWSPDKSQSKFTRWFCEEDKKTPGNASVEKPSSLISSIIGVEKGGSGGLKDMFTRPISSPEILPAQISSKSASPTVLTCEDLEQSILSEIGGNPKSRSVEKEQATHEVKKDGLPGNCFDNSASQHLLSLLHKGMGSDKAVSTIGLVERLPNDDQELGKSSLPESNNVTYGVRELNHSDKTLTLESLFGTAFMTELHSSQRNSVASARMDVPDGGAFPPKMGENGDEVGSHEGNILRSNDGFAKLDKEANWPDFKDTGKKMDLSRLPSEAYAKFSDFDGGVGVKFPGEDSLINPVDPINAENSVWIPNSSSNTSVNVMEKLAALGGAIKDERSMLNPFDMRNPEIPYQNLHSHASFPQQLHTPPMNHNRTSVHSVDSHPAHIDPRVFHHDSRMHHRFPSNMDHPSFPRSNAGLATFDHLVPPPVLQHMHMAGSHPPLHPVRGFPGASPMGPQSGHTPAGFFQEHNPMQVLPFGQRQPNFGGPGMMPSGPEFVANNPPEAFQRLLEMEMRANPKPMHPFAADNPSRAMYEHELDMGYRHR